MAMDIPTNSSEPEAAANTLIKGYLSKDCAGSSDVTLSESEARNNFHEYTGVLTGNINVIVPTEEKGYWIYNNTTGSFTLTVKTSAGTGVAVTQTKKVLLACDGANVVAWSSEV